MAAKLKTLPIIRVAEDHWDEISGVLPKPKRATWGNTSTRDRQKAIFVSIITILWNDDPVRGKPSSGIYTSNERMQHYLIEWAYAGYLQRMWQLYLGLLSVTQRKAWLDVFIRKPTRNTRPRRNTFWYHHLATILTETAKKHPKTIRLSNWP